MMYEKNHGYVIAILSNGKVLRENNGNVYLNFHSEYAIRIKNNNKNRVGIRVLVDGTDITDGKIILDKCETFDLKRMIIDGDLDKGPRLLFVPHDDDRVQNPFNSENGRVSVEFYPEIKYDLKQPSYPYDKESPWPIKYSSETKINMPIDNDNTSISRDLLSNVMCQNNTITYNCCISDCQKGATVAGDDISQSFTTTNFNCASTPITTMHIQIIGKKKTQYVNNTRYKFCANCGHKMKRLDKFCVNCGYKAIPINCAV